jgi:hypothetical protein
MGSGRAENRTQMDPKGHVGYGHARSHACLLARGRLPETPKSPPRFLPRAGSQIVAAVSAYLRIGSLSSNHLLGFGFITDDRPHLSHTRRSALEGALHSCRRQHEGTSNRIVAYAQFVKDCASAELASSPRAREPRSPAMNTRGRQRGVKGSDAICS